MCNIIMANLLIGPILMSVLQTVEKDYSDADFTAKIFHGGGDLLSMQDLFAGKKFMTLEYGSEWCWSCVMTKRYVEGTPVRPVKQYLYPMLKALGTVSVVDADDNFVMNHDTNAFNNGTHNTFNIWNGPDPWKGSIEAYKNITSSAFSIGHSPEAAADINIDTAFVGPIVGPFFGLPASQLYRDASVNSDTYPDPMTKFFSTSYFADPWLKPSNTKFFLLEHLQSTKKIRAYYPTFTLYLSGTYDDTIYKRPDISIVDEGRDYYIQQLQSILQIPDGALVAKYNEEESLTTTTPYISGKPALCEYIKEMWCRWEGQASKVEFQKFHAMYNCPCSR
jgi:hypothetical protein